ncbi:hypothetical protein [Actinomadura oligospora]|uniref:hypothetical protein n=1 Tax=Actinomadura oligospora TaxID=111804 RepID=UPI000479D874|nr:hypothetical protein [Actinomadura oligospora]
MTIYTMEATSLESIQFKVTDDGDLILICGSCSQPIQGEMAETPYLGSGDLEQAVRWSVEHKCPDPPEEKGPKYVRVEWETTEHFSYYFNATELEEEELIGEDGKLDRDRLAEVLADRETGAFDFTADREVIEVEVEGE